MIRVGRRGLALVGTAVLTAGVLGVTPATVASARPNALSGLASATPFSQAKFGAYGTGSELHTGALQTGGTKLLSVEQAFSGNTVSSAGLGGSVVSSLTGAVVQSDQTANNANTYGRGAGLELGLATGIAQPNQTQLGIAEAHAPPTTGLISKTAIPLDLRPLVHALLLTGRASAAYSSTFCPLGQPLAYGEGDASAPTGVVTGTPPLVSGTGASGTQAAQSRTRTDLVANADGTFGIQNQVQEIITPLTINLGPTVTLAVTVQGDGPDSPLTVQTFNDGEGNSGRRFINADPTVKIDLITTVAGITTTVPVANVQRSLLAGVINPLLGTGGVTQTLLATLGVNLAIDVGVPNPGSGAASVVFDLLHINASVPAAGITIADVRLGHIESQVTLTSGAITCTVPVGKDAKPPSVNAGDTFVQTISVPRSVADLADSTCDLTHIKVTDKLGVNSGSPTFTVGAISNNGHYDPATKTITWDNIGDYHVAHGSTPADPPKLLTISITVPASSGSGVLMDTAAVTAGLGNCTGGASGQATLIGNVGNVVISGGIILVAPSVGASGGPLARTGGAGPMIAWIGAALLAAAEVTRRMVRRARQPELS